MGRRVLFDGEVWVHYGQVYVCSDEDLPGLDGAFVGQENGLCGAASPGVLYLITGLHTGQVGFAVEVHDEAPAVDDSWDEVVEVSFTPESELVAIVAWAGEETWELDLEQRDWRVRYCAAGMDAAHRQDTLLDGDDVVDRYLLQLWPSEPAADRIVKQTSEQAAYWHREAPRRAPRRPTPPPEPDPAGPHEAEVRRFWGGRPPSERLQHVGGNVRGLAGLDRDLLDVLAEASPDLLREIARWAARRAYGAAGLVGLDWADAALDVLDRGEPVPDMGQLFVLLATDPGVPSTLVTGTEGGPRNVSQQYMAVPALHGAAEPDPLRAAVDALYAAAVTMGGDYGLLFEELGRGFPMLGG